MFILIRLIIGVVFLIGAFLLFRKYKPNNMHKNFMMIIILSFILFISLCFVPFENLLITFESPEDVYNYMNTGNSQVELVVSGGNTDLVIGRNNEANIYLIVPKSSGGWKIGLSSSTKRVTQKIDNGIVMYLYQYKETDEHYLTILNTNGGESTVFDSYNSKFYYTEKANEELNKTFVTYYTYISNMNSFYWVNINGNIINLVD